ncbi:hypothetical protein AB6A40_000677 [Gnathostoma spinigerum]|uniref:RRM domain-containing protein n=1 Tax=Gnathostoma spinigerum TaxID=75299 RepID=A0ABD6E2M8_9BILA
MSWIIRLQRLPLSANAADIRSFFSGLRIPDGAVHIVGGPDGDAFIGFATDEDARQAMRFDQRKIHDQPVRLLLSSRVEMDAVIAKARSGDLGGGGLVSTSLTSPPRRDEPMSASGNTPRYGQLNAVRDSEQYGMETGVFNARSTPRTSFGSSESSRQTGYTGEVSRGNENPWNRPVVQTSSPLDSWKNSGSQSSNAYDPRAVRQPIISQQSVTSSAQPWQDPKMMNALSANQSGGVTTSAQSVTQPSIYQQRGPDERYMQHYDHDGNTFQGYNASIQPQSTETSLGGFLSDQISASSASYSQLGSNGRMVSNPPALNVSSNPFAANSYSSSNAPIFPPMPIRRTSDQDECYVELSRLPSDLLRPAALEQFLRPSVPLTLSSVKVVFDPKGFPVHSLVRFGNSKDAENVLSRDGEQGIRIRSCTKEKFDDAIDGSLQIPPTALPYLHSASGDSRERDRPSSRSNRNDRNERGEPAATSRHRREDQDRRDSNPRREDREDWRESRDDVHRFGAGRRGRSRSPVRDFRESKRRREDAERYCIEFTNLPFRTSESEIREFLGPRCEPTRVTRAYYEDGSPSDRWIIEYRRMDIAERAYRVHGKVQDRLIRARRIGNEEADAILSIPDKFGLQRKEEYERKMAAINGEPMHVDSRERPMGTTSYDRYSEGGADFSVHPGNVPPYDGPFRGRGRGRGSFRGGFAGGHEFDGPSGPRGPVGMAGSGGPGLLAPPNTGGPQRFAGPRPLRASGPAAPKGSGRTPLISPPTFFAATPSSNIRQRGPPSQHPSPRGPPLLPNGPRPNNGPAGPGGNLYANGHAQNGPSFTPTSTDKTCVLLENIPSDISDLDLARFLGVTPSKVTQGLRFTPDGVAYIDFESSEDVTTACRSNRKSIGDSVIRIVSLTRQQMLDDFQKKMIPCEEKEIDAELVASVGEPGTVISCHGFPANVTLTDVSRFFDRYSLVENSVRIKLDDHGVPTGECLLAVGSMQEATKAVAMLNGRRLNGSIVTMSVVKSSR